MHTYTRDIENSSHHQSSFTCMYLILLLLVLDPGSGAVGDPFLTIGLPIIVVAVLAILTVLATIILLTRFYRRLVYYDISYGCTHVVFGVLLYYPPIHK